VEDQMLYPKNNTSEEVKISILRNAVYYFLQFVYLIREESGCRLVVIHQGRLLEDINYKTVKGAKIGFFRRYRWKKWGKGVKPDWTTFSPSGDHRLSFRLGDMAIASISIAAVLKDKRFKHSNYVLTSTHSTLKEIPAGIDIWRPEEQKPPRHLF
jgi:intergrase/recombinase